MTSASARLSGYGVHDERTARVAWARVAEPADDQALRWITERGALVAFADLVEHAAAGSGQAERFLLRLPEVRADRDLEIAERIGARILTPGDAEWPAELDDLLAPPWCLWVRGPLDLADASTRGVAVVGARAATSYGEHLAGQIAASLAARGFPVVSGAAFGIDAAAHWAALGEPSSDGQSEGAGTVAYLACGVDQVYPRAHHSLLRRISEEGAVVSEIPPGCAPLKHRFLLRNRLIAAGSRGTVLIEAGLRSGARATVGMAAALGRPVAAVPGSVFSAVSAGCHAEIRDQRAVLVTDPAEVIELMGAMGSDLSPASGGQARPGDDLTPQVRKIYDGLQPRRARSAEDLARRAGLGLSHVLASLGELQLVGMADRRADGWVKVTS